MVLKDYAGSGILLFWYMETVIDVVVILVSESKELGVESG